MNKKLGSILVFSFALVLATGFVSISINSNSAVFAITSKYAAKLSGQNEVPPNTSKATGEASFISSNKDLTFSISATGITSATAGHIHQGKPGENGPILVTLFNNTSPTNTVEEKGVITASMLEGPLKGKTISNLITAMENGDTYANIHTTQHPKGEIRGDITGGTSSASKDTSSTSGKHTTKTVKHTSSGPSPTTGGGY
jgi:CHRD domain